MWSSESDFYVKKLPADASSLQPGCTLNPFFSSDILEYSKSVAKPDPLEDGITYNDDTKVYNLSSYSDDLPMCPSLKETGSCCPISILNELKTEFDELKESIESVSEEYMDRRIESMKKSSGAFGKGISALVDVFAAGNHYIIELLKEIPAITSNSTFLVEFSKAAGVNELVKVLFSDIEEYLPEAKRLLAEASGASSTTSFKYENIQIDLMWDMLMQYVKLSDEELLHYKKATRIGIALINRFNLFDTVLTDGFSGLTQAEIDNFMDTYEDIIEDVIAELVPLKINIDADTLAEAEAELDENESSTSFANYI